jgi:glycyl-tRNA synthetase beta chain
MSDVLLLEIGTEELPASFVASGVDALPGLLGAKLAEARLSHGAIVAAGTPRRLAVWAEDVAERQPDLDEEVTGPPSRIAFDASGAPTRAAQSFAEKIGVAVETLGRVQTDKGEYVVGRKREAGRPALDVLTPALTEVCQKIPFRKSMRWSDGETAFGRPVRWLIALLGAHVIPFEFAGLSAGRTSHGHRFLSPEAFELAAAKDYVDALRARHVLVRMEERAGVMQERLAKAAGDAGGVLIEDAFLVGENASLVEEPQVVVGGFDQEFLALPERVILDVAKGHQRYFGVRRADGTLLPNYLAVVNTAKNPENIRRGNDRVMRARLADAKFFYDEDLKIPLGTRREKLDAVVFHKRLGSIGNKVARLTRLVDELGRQLSLPNATVADAHAGALLAKCDLTTLMVGELPELQGEMGHAYALKQGVAPAVARVISEHYQPKGADDPPAPSDAGALLALADRLDTLTGCFAVGIMPTGTADPLALRRAAIGILRTLLDKGWELSLRDASSAAYVGLTGIELDQSAEATLEKLLPFLEQRLRGVLTERLPQDAVDACLASDADVPSDVAARAAALGALPADVRASAGEVFKRAANIAKNAPAGEPRPPQEVEKAVHASEAALFAALEKLDTAVSAAREKREYGVIVHAIAEFAPTLGKYFDDVMVMAEDAALRENRLRTMGKVQRMCSSVANFNLLAG